MKSSKGQSAIEYILLAACVIAVLIVFLSPSGKMFNTVSSGINATADQIYVMANKTDFSKGYFCGDGSCCDNPAYCNPIEDASSCCQDCGGCGGTGGPPPSPVDCHDFSNISTCTAHLDDCMWVTPYGLSCSAQIPYCTKKNPGFCKVYNPDSGVCCTYHVGCPPCPL